MGRSGRRIPAWLGAALLALGVASEGRAQTVWVAPTQTDGEQALLAGVSGWLERLLGDAGLTVQRAAGPGQPLAQRLRGAQGRGLSWLVTPELRVEQGRARLQLRLFAAESGSLVAVAAAAAPLHQLGSLCRETSLRLMTQIGVPPAALPEDAPPLPEDLAAAGRALQLWDSGRLAAALDEVSGRLTPLALRVREEILDEAGRSGADPLERARVLATTGDARGAWRLVSDRAAEAERAPRPDPQVLIAAGEVQLAAGNLPGARGFLERALTIAPDAAAAQLSRARLALEQGDVETSRRALERVASLEPELVLPVRLLAETEPSKARQAELWLEAGRRAARRLDVQRAERYLDRALRIEPALAPRSWMARGDLELRLGRPAEAAERYEQARRNGVGDVALFRNLGRAQWALGHAERAEEAFRLAIEVDASDVAAWGGLGVVYLETGRSSQAAEALERAQRGDPADPELRFELARALHGSGRSREALALLSDDTARELRESARILAGQGRPAEARSALERAIALEPYHPEGQRQLAELLEARGDLEAAAEARELAAFFAGSLAVDSDVETELALSLDALVASFAAQVVDPQRKPVALLGVRRAPDWRSRLWAWLHPRRLDTERVAATLEQAIGRQFDLVRTPEMPRQGILGRAVDALYRFESEASLSAPRIAAVNDGLGTHGIFVARVWRDPHPGEEGASCSGLQHFEIELRLLSGRDIDYVDALANVACPVGGVAAFGTWNLYAAPLYAALLGLLLYPPIRGWGTVVVRVGLPARTRGFFALSITRKPDKVRDEKKDPPRFRRLRATLRLISRFHRQMVGRETVFRLIPARRSYYVTLKGPLKDAKGEEIIGHFLEERRVRVQRGKLVRVEYDLRPKECAIEARVLLEGRGLRGARVAIAGDPKSLRYAQRDGSAFLYVGPGSHRVLMGAEGRVAARTIQVSSVENAIPLVIDLAQAQDLIFEGCPQAVDPYLQGDRHSAARALEEAGLGDAAHRLRAELFQSRGDSAGAARELEAAGRLDEAAEAHQEAGSDPNESAALFERAGDHAQAAEAYRRAGDLAAAARCFEACYDYDNAIECYHETGDQAKLLALLEQTGAFLEAAERARRSGDADRAIRNLQQIARNDSSWPEGTALLAELLAERGDYDIALEAFGDALEAAGGERAPVGLQERHALLLEKCGERERALQAWARVGKLDPSRGDIGTRISTLREALQRDAKTAPTVVAAGASATLRVESRYELLEELGRGGMGVVFKARDKRLGRLVALKQLPQNLREHPEALKLFLREARAAASLNHRNIVTVHDAGEEGGSYFITMELLEGLPLSAILARRGRLSAKDTARLGIQTAAGLDYAHGRRVVHRDVKAANLFLTRERVVKIMDFGLAKTVEEVRKSSTLIGGTPYYMAPEQAAGEPVDHRTDLYALGVTLFQLATGELPFRDGDLAYHHRHTPPPDPRELLATLPAGLAELILTLMAKAPGDRIQSAAEVGARLASLVDEPG